MAYCGLDVIASTNVVGIDPFIWQSKLVAFANKIASAS